MTGMNVWKRATLAIVRKPVRSGIIGLLMLMVFTSLVAQVGASTALQKMSDDIGGSLGIGFTVDTGENPVSPKEASRFSRIPGVGKPFTNVRPWRRWMARIRLSPNMVLDWIPAYPRRSACWAPLTPRCPKSSKAACTGWNKDTTFQVMAGTY